MNVLEWLLHLLLRVTDKPTITFTKVITGTGYVNPKVTNFIAKIKPAAEAIEKDFGIPWRFAMIQAAHESAWGLSRLTVEVNNLFGVTGDTWYQEGKPVYWIMTKEYAKDQTPFEIKRPFRKYDSWEGSLRDWAGLITRRYPKALEAAKIGDFTAFAHELQEGGYATDPRYAVQLVQLHDEIKDIG